MNVKVNGKSIKIPNEVTTIETLLSHLKLDKKIVIIEHNKEILQKEDHEGTSVFDGDQIEIVTFVGGG